MSVDSFDFNQESVSDIASYLFSRFEKADRNAGRLLISALRQDFPHWTEEVGVHRDIAFKAAVALFAQYLERRLADGAGQGVRIDYRLVQKADFLLSDYVGVYTSALRSVRTGLDSWLLDGLEEASLDGVDELVARLQTQVEGVERLIGDLEACLAQKRITVANSPAFSWFWSLCRFSFSVLDLTCLKELDREVLGLRRDAAILRQWVANYAILRATGSDSLAKFQSKPYQIFQALEPNYRDVLTTVYFYTRIENANRGEKLVPSDKLDGILKEKLPFSDGLKAFEAYHRALDQALYEESRMLKEMAAKGELDTDSGKETVSLWLEARRAETQKLKVMIWRVREFLLRTDPDPYVHTRMGWHDRQLGPEPKQTQPLQFLSQALRRLDSLFHRMSEAVHEFERSEYESQEQSNIQLAGQLFSLIRELSVQGTEDEARSCAAELLKKWAKLDEVCSFNKQDVTLDEVLIRKALIYDEFNVLQNKPQFHEIYRQHIAIRHPFGDQNQRQRLKQLKGNDLAGGLEIAEAFLASVREQMAVPESREEARRQLLEFLYAFSRFRKNLAVILPGTIDAKLKEVMVSIHELDVSFYEKEQELMLGFHPLERVVPAETEDSA